MSRKQPRWLARMARVGIQFTLIPWPNGVLVVEATPFSWHLDAEKSYRSFSLYVGPFYVSGAW